MNRNESKKWLYRLYGQGQTMEVLFTLPGDPTKAVRRTRKWPEDVVRILDEMARAEEAGYNVYASVLPAEVRETGMVDRVWADMDNPDAPWPFGADDRWEGAAWPKPSVLVKTSDGGEGGFRWQAIWLLDKPLPEAEARDLIRRLAKKAGADTSVHDPRRVFRVPGLMNQKRGSQARLMETTSGTISPEAFDLPADDFVANLLDVDVSNPAHVLGEWLGGTSEGDRARKAYVCARFLKSCQVSHGDALAIVNVGAQRSEPPLTEREVRHAVDSAYHRPL